MTKLSLSRRLLAAALDAAGEHLAGTDESTAGGVLLALFVAGAAVCVGFYALGEIKPLRHELGILRAAVERISPRTVPAPSSPAPAAASPN